MPRGAIRGPRAALARTRCPAGAGPQRGRAAGFRVVLRFHRRWNNGAPRPRQGALFVNISADALVHGVGMVGMAKKLGEAVRRCGLNARMLVLEITEHERVTNMPARNH